MTEKLENKENLARERGQVFRANIVNCNLNIPLFSGNPAGGVVNCPLPRRVLPKINADEYYDDVESFAAANPNNFTEFQLLTKIKNIKPLKIKPGANININIRCHSQICGYRDRDLE